MDLHLGVRTSSPILLHPQHTHSVQHHGPDIIHGHEAYKELIVVLVLGHILFVGVVYWLYTTQQQSSRRRNSKSRLPSVKSRQGMAKKLAIV